MGHAAIDNMGTVHARFYCVQGAADLGQHTAVDGAVFDQRIYLLGAQSCQDFAFLVFQPFDVGQQHQFFGFQDFGHFAGHEIGIDVI